MAGKAAADGQVALTVEQRRRNAADVREAAARLGDVENKALGLVTAGQALAREAAEIRRVIDKALGAAGDDDGDE